MPPSAVGASRCSASPPKRLGSRLTPMANCSPSVNVTLVCDTGVPGRYGVLSASRPRSPVEESNATSAWESRSTPLSAKLDDSGGCSCRLSLRARRAIAEDIVVDHFARSSRSSSSAARRSLVRHRRSCVGCVIRTIASASMRASVILPMLR